MADKTVRVVLTARDAGLTTTFGRAGASAAQLAATTASAGAQVTQLTKTSQKASRTIGTLSPAILGVGLGVAGAAKSFMDFDKNMSAVAANTGKTGADLERLRKLAIDLGAATQYSGAEAAAGINEMAKAGVSTTAILNGGLKGALDLAASGQLGVAEAAEAAATALKVFNLEGTEMSHVADLYAAAANKAMGSVQDVAAAMGYVGPVAANMNMSIEETVGVLGMFAEKGLVGQKAGTTLRSMLLSLSAPTKAAQTAMDDLGLSMYDNQGNFVGMEAAAGQLQTVLSKLPEEQRNAALAKIFDTEAMQGAIFAYQGGSQAIQQWTDDVNQAGFASQQAKTLTDNLAGDIERFTGAIDGAILKSGGGLNDFLRTTMQGVTALVDVMNGLPGPVLQGAVALGVMRAAGAFLPNLGAQFDGARGRISAFGAAIAAQKAPSDAAIASYRALGFNATQAAAAASRAAPQVGTLTASIRALGGVTGVMKSAASGLLGALGGPWGVGIAAAGALVMTLGQRMSETRARTESLRDAIAASGDAMSEASRKAVAYDLANSGLLQTLTESGVAAKDAVDAVMGLPGAYDRVNASLNTNMIAHADAMTAVRGHMEQYEAAKRSADLLKTAEDGVGASAKNTASAVDGTAGAIDGAAKSAEDAAKAVDDMAKAVGDLGSAALSHRASVRDFQAAIDDAADAVKENGKTLDVNTEKGRANQAALDDIASSGVKAAQAILESGGSIKEASAQVTSTRKAFIAAATQMGMNTREANKLADKLGLTSDAVSTLSGRLNGLPKNVTPKVDVVGLDAAQRGLADLARQLGSMDNRTYEARFVTTYVNRGLAPTGAVRAAARATGGPVFGPGTATSDSIPALLSNGEHVLTAAEVDAAGGHDAVYRLRRALKAGTAPRFATGGAVGGWDYGSATDRAAWSAPDIISLLTGVDLPDLHPAVRKVRDGISRVGEMLDRLVESSKTAIEQADRAAFDAAVTAEKAARAASTVAQATSAATGTATVARKFIGALGSAQAKPYLPAILAMAAKYNVAPELIAAVIKQESGFNPNAGSPAGARGLMQLMPGTFRGLGVKGSILNPTANIEAGTKYLAQQIAAFNGNLTKVLQAYNAGPGAARSGAANRYAETQNYVKRITADAGVRSLAGGLRMSSSAAQGAAAAVVKTTTTAVMTQQQKLIAYGKELRRLGFDVGENRALGDNPRPGVHSRGGYHYRNNNSAAIDVNADRMRGGERANLDKAAAAANALGLRTIWQAKGHYDHLHVDTSTGASIGFKGRGGLPINIAKTAVAAVKKSSAVSAGAGTPAVEVERQYALSAAAAKQIEAQRAAVDGLKASLVAAAPYMEDVAVAHATAAENAEKYTAELAELTKAHADYAASVGSALVKQGELSTLWRVEDGSVTDLSYVIHERRKLVDLWSMFRDDIGNLKRAGLNQADLQDIMGMGITQGGRLAQQLLEQSQFIDQLNSTRDGLESAGAQVGANFADIVYGTQIDAARGVAEAWQDETKMLADVAWQVGSAMQAEILRGLGLSDGRLSATTTTLLEQMRQQWLVSLGIATTGGTATAVAGKPSAPAGNTGLVDAIRKLVPDGPRKVVMQVGQREFEAYMTEVADTSTTAAFTRVATAGGVR